MADRQIGDAEAVNAMLKMHKSVGVPVFLVSWVKELIILRFQNVLRFVLKLGSMIWR